MPAIAALLIPLVPGLLKTIMDIVNAATGPELTPEEMKARLDGISADLKGVVAAVQAVQLPNKA